MRREEIEEAFQRYGPMVYRRARSILGNDEEAKDVMQDVFIKILTGRLERKGPIGGWLCTVTTNLCLNRIRDTGRRRALRERHLKKDEPITNSPEHRVLVRALLAEADERTAQAAVAFHIDGMSYAEVATQMGVSKRTVSNLLQRFRTFAEKRLAAEPRVAEGSA